MENVDPDAHHSEFALWLNARRATRLSSMTEFGRFTADGSYEHVRTIDQSVLRQCPNVILAPEHYRDDGTCYCNDRFRPEMKEWGYRWSKKLGHWN